MKSNSVLYFAIVIILTITNACTNTIAKLETYPQPKDADGDLLPGSPKFKVMLLVDGKEVESFVYYSQGERRYDIIEHFSPDDVNKLTDLKKDELSQDGSSFIENKSVSFTSFSFKGEVIVKVIPQYINKVEKCIVRPLSKGIVTILEGNAATFKITKPGQFSVEFNDEFFDKENGHAMLVFANPLEECVPDTEKASGHLHYFGPGIHEIGVAYGLEEKNVRKINDGDTIYIAGGAYLKGSIFTRAKNVSIFGRGVVSGEQFIQCTGRFIAERNAITLGDSAYFEGITVSNPGHFCYLGGKNSIFRNLKAMAWYGSTDGVSTGGDSIIEDCFFMVNDDNIKPGNNMIVRRNTHWIKDWGGFIMFSYNVNKDYGNAHVYDCDIIHAEDKVNAGNSGLFLAYHGGNANISDLLIEDIRCECDIPYLVDITIARRGSVSDICFKNIRIAGILLHPSRLIGNSPEHQLSDFRFEDLNVNDKSVKTFEDINLFVGPFVKNVRIISNGVQDEKSSITDDEKATIIVPVADITVEVNSKKAILSGTHSIMKNSNEVFMKFDLSQIKEVRQATLVLLLHSWFVKSRYNLDDGIRISVSKVGNNWDKATINWENSRNLNGREITSFKPNDNLMEVDLTDFVKENAGQIVSLKFESNLNSWAGFKSSNACSPALVILCTPNPIY